MIEKFSVVAGALIMTLVFTPFTLAQNYPQRPIRMVVPFAPGGATDIIARILEPRLSQKLGQQVVVDNRAGAAGNIAVELVATAAPDGYTLLVGNISTNSINPLLFSKNMSVDALKDLAGVTQLVAIPNFVLGSPKVPANTLKEAMEYAKSRNGQLNYGAPLGSYSHLDMLALTQRAGVKMLHIPTKGAGETLTNLIRGDSHIQISNVASNMGPVRSGQIKAYAVTSEKRLAELPNVPTMAEAGFAGIGSLNWNGIFAPAKTPRAVIDKVFRDSVAAMQELEAEGLLAKRQLPIALSTSAKEFDGYVRSEAKRWEKIIKDNNLRID
ncbi:MAG TPA: tripartite tricarboxylate transporter substrate-binding protein [Burkholderiales bacterium]|nr:tripartite tricarboxylate transporter substrate-binding protein [Burkholderiales bacterium]